MAYTNSNSHNKALSVCVKNVCKSYTGSDRTLDNISMNVEEGMVYGLLGSSGSGKTSILSCIAGLRSWNSGEITVFGKRVTHRDKIDPEKVGYMPQDCALQPQLTITEMFHFFGSLYHMTSERFQEQIAMLGGLLNLPDYSSRLIENLSGGQQRRVSLALTLLHSPKLLILDEPTVGLDPLLRENIWQYLYNLASTQGTSIIITTHYIEEVKKSNRVGVMRKGTILVEDDPADLMKAHNTSILEEVVLEICRKDRQNRRKSFEAHETIDFTSAQNNERKLSLSSVKISNPERKSSQPCSDNGSNQKKKSSPSFDCLARSLRRTLAYSKVVWINFSRHYMFIVMLLLLPPFQLFSTGAVIGVEPKYTPMAIINYEVPHWKSQCFDNKLQVGERLSMTCDLTMTSCDLISQFTRGTFLEAMEYTSAEEARLAVTRGDIIGYLEIPKNYSSHIVERALSPLFVNNDTVDGSTVKLHLDMSEFVTIFVLLTELFQSFDAFVKQVTAACNFDLSLVEIPFFYREPVYGHLDTTAQDYVLPALIAGVLFEVTFAVTPMVFINDVKQGTLDRSRVAGLKFSEMICGIFMTITSITVLQAAICYISLGYGLGFEIIGSIGAYGVLCLVTAFCGGAFGLSVGIMFQDVFMLLLAAIFIIPILMIYAGILRPIEIIPFPYRTLIFYLFPSAGIVEPFRFVMNRGVGLTHPMVWPGIIVTLVWGLVFSTLCLILLHKLKK